MILLSSSLTFLYFFFILEHFSPFLYKLNFTKNTIESTHPIRIYVFSLRLLWEAESAHYAADLASRCLFLTMSVALDPLLPLCGHFVSLWYWTKGRMLQYDPQENTVNFLKGSMQVCEWNRSKILFNLILGEDVLKYNI